ncbi:MAG: IS30 family transposase, partial [Acidimicrobiales bacterium]
LIRQYFPKGTDFRKITQTQVEEALERINHRPRKVLDFRSPY